MGPGPPPGLTGAVRCWGAAATVAASSSVGLALVIWAAAVDPADVPMMRSAVVTSSPASNRPAMTPINQALPVDPPPPRTKARSPAAGTRPASAACGWPWSDVGRSEAVVGVTCRGEEGAVFMGVASRELPDGALPVATTSVAGSCTAGEHPLRTLRSWVSPPADGSRSPERSHTGDAVRNRMEPPGPGSFRPLEGGSRRTGSSATVDGTDRLGHDRRMVVTYSDLRSKTVLVTGGSRGIGAQTARAF